MRGLEGGCIADRVENVSEIKCAAFFYPPLSATCSSPVIDPESPTVLEAMMS